MLPIFYHPKVKKDLKNLDRGIAHEILTSVILDLADNPEKGVKLSGDLKNFYKFPFSLKGVSYRIIYQIQESKQKELYILFIGVRENAYDKVLRRL
jgi:mRNA-degrading endonuclease RelE of RelBE toxin-antitoxin system